MTRTHQLVFISSYSLQACTLNPRHVEALLLKGCILLELRKLHEAIAHFGEVFKVAPFRHEAYRGEGVDNLVTA